MQYVHVRNLAKYQPGYTDRKHIWAKIYYEIFLDEEVQGLDEIDRYRFWSLIVFEVYTQKPIALTDTNLKILGWETKKRRISLTLQMLHTLVEVRNIQSKATVTQIRVEESRGEENRIDNNTILFDKWNSFKNVKKWKSHSKLSHEIQQAITEQLKHYSIDDLGAAIANYAAVLNSPNYAVFNVCEKSWDKYWTLREFLTRGTKADRSEKYLYRFLPTNFQPSDFLTQKAKSQKRSEAKAWQAAKEQKEAQEQVVERGQSLTKLYGSMPIEELRQRYKSLDTTRFEKSLIRKVRPEVTER